jgi:hypothetical protein
MNLIIQRILNTVYVHVCSTKYRTKLLYKSNHEALWKFGKVEVFVNDIHEEIKSRLNSGDACYYAVRNLLSSHLLPENVKVYNDKVACFFVWVWNVVSHIEKNMYWESLRRGWTQDWQSDSMKDRDHLKYLGVDRKIILKWIFGK